eukprot:CAMPEP_0119128752 /NCGR_PEP_ID=MMETSP1310-20130426/6782_1 /TAXON_ID=464262 /ORGANISM="Genus nov. species nov., Strain RCC2339" /LENGTH=905 /DNA_ID=CAMNT_0007119123 /DNA_START=8 /DNA_END=2725 /DNA_ORIENTATION=+
MATYMQAADTEDESWRLRKASIRLLRQTGEAAVNRPGVVLCAVLRPVVARLTDRIESVQLEAVSALRSLLTAEGLRHLLRFFATPNVVEEIRWLGPELLRVMGALLGRLEQSFGDRTSVGVDVDAFSLPATVGVLELCEELIEVAHNTFANDLAAEMCGALGAALSAGGSVPSRLEFAALRLATRIVATHSAERVAGQAAGILAVVLGHVERSSSRLLVLESLRFISAGSATGWTTLVPGELDIPSRVLRACLAALGNPESDSAVRTVALEAVGHLLATSAEHFSPGEVDSAIREAAAGLDNETIRLAATGALTEVTSARDGQFAHAISGLALDRTVPLLRLRTRAVQLSALQLLRSLFESDSALEKMSYSAEDLLQALEAVLTPDDLGLCTAAVATLAACLRRVSAMRAVVKGRAFDLLVELAHNPVVRGQALDAFCDFFSAVVETKVHTAATVVKNITRSVQEARGASASLSSSANATDLAPLNGAAIIARVLSHSKSRSKSPYLTKPPSLEEGNDTEVEMYVATLGYLSVLTGTVDVTKGATDYVWKAIHSSSPAVRQAAARSIGDFCRSDPAIVDRVIGDLDDGILRACIAQALSSFVKTALSHSVVVANPAGMATRLIQCTAGESNDVKTALSDAVGHLAILDPVQVMPVLAKELESQENGEQLATCTRALRQAMVHGADNAALVKEAQPLVEGCFGSALGSDDHEVLRAALDSLKTLALQSPGYVQAVAPVLVARLCKVTERKRERKVKFGPFTHIVDDEEPVRFIAYECLKALYRFVPAGAVLETLLDRLIAGLADGHNNALLCFSAFCDVCSSPSSSVLLEKVEPAVAALEKHLVRELSKNAVKQDVDRHQELVAATLRAVRVLAQVHGVDRNASFQVFMRETVQSGVHKAAYEALL